MIHICVLQAIQIARRHYIDQYRADYTYAVVIKDFQPEVLLSTFSSQSPSSSPPPPSQRTEPTDEAADDIKHSRSCDEIEGGSSTPARSRYGDVVERSASDPEFVIRLRRRWKQQQKQKDDAMTDDDVDGDDAVSQNQHRSTPAAGAVTAVNIVRRSLSSSNTAADQRPPSSPCRSPITTDLLPSLSHPSPSLIAVRHANSCGSLQSTSASPGGDDQLEMTPRSTLPRVTGSKLQPSAGRSVTFSWVDWAQPQQLQQQYQQGKRESVPTIAFNGRPVRPTPSNGLSA